MPEGWKSGLRPLHPESGHNLRVFPEGIANRSTVDLYGLVVRAVPVVVLPYPAVI